MDDPIPSRISFSHHKHGFGFVGWLVNSGSQFIYGCHNMKGSLRLKSKQGIISDVEDNGEILWSCKKTREY